MQRSEGVLWPNVGAVLGDIVQSKNESTEQIINGTAIPHPNYPGGGGSFKYGSVDHDIGLIRLNTPAILNDYVQTIALPKKLFRVKLFSPYQDVTSYGWGVNNVTAQG